MHTVCVNSSMHTVYVNSSMHTVYVNSSMHTVYVNRSKTLEAPNTWPFNQYTLGSIPFIATIHISQKSNSNPSTFKLIRQCYKRQNHTLQCLNNTFRWLSNNANPNKHGHLSSQCDSPFETPKVCIILELMIHDSG